MNWQEKAKELFGEHWKPTLSILSGINRRDIRRMANGQNDAPQWLIEAVDETYRVWREE
jgi:hypothetical protein